MALVERANAIVVLSFASPAPWNFQPLQIATYIVFADLGVFASYLLLTRLPQLMQVAPSIRLIESANRFLDGRGCGTPDNTAQISARQRRFWIQ